MADARHSTDRRTFLSAAPVAAVAMALPAAALASRGEPDAGFWALHRNWRALEDMWEGDDGLVDGEDESVWDAAAAKVSSAFDAMMICPVKSVAAVLAKYRACQAQEVLIGDGKASSLTMIERDLALIARREVAA